MKTSVEVYGRTPSIDPHYENPQVSFPQSDAKYMNVWPMTSNTNDGLKLIIGTVQFNYLVTVSIRIYSVHSSEVGSSTKTFHLNSPEASKSNQIFLDRKVYQETKVLGEDVGCNRIKTSHSLYQLR